MKANIVSRLLIYRYADTETLLSLLACRLMFPFSKFLPIVHKYRTILNRRIYQKSRLLLRFGDFTYVGRVSDVFTLLETHQDKVYHLVPRFIPKSGDVVVDAGCNIGEYAITAAKAVGHKGKVIAFEPNANAVELLRCNILLNRLDNLMIIPKAVYVKSGTIKIYTSLESNIGDGIMPFGKRFGRPVNNSHNSSSYMTKVIDLDTALRGEKRIDLIKMDIEGAEYLALKGAGEILHKKKPRIIVELHGRQMRKCVLAYLMQVGYCLIKEVTIANSITLAYLEIAE